MLKIIILILVLSIKLIEPLHVDDFCHKIKDLNCTGKYSLECGGVYCTKNKSSCQSLMLFSTVTFTKDAMYKLKYNIFKSQISNCSFELFNQKLSKLKTNPMKADAFCYKKKELDCDGTHSLKCVDIYCTKDQKSCKNIIMFTSVKFIKQGFYKQRYELFKKQIRNCSQSIKYKWNSKDVCLNAKNCIKPSIHRLWSIQMIPIECKCTGKHSFRCNGNYCALNKQACDGLKSKPITKIMKC